MVVRQTESKGAQPKAYRGSNPSSEGTPFFKRADSHIPEIERVCQCFRLGPPQLVSPHSD